MSQTINTFGFSQALLERTSQVVFSYDLTSGKFTYLNPAFEQVFLKTRESASNLSSLLSMVHPEDLNDLEAKYRQVLDGKLLRDIEFRILLDDLRERWLCLTPYLLEEKPGQRQIIGFADDITHSKNHSSYLKRYSDKKNAVLNILSHDLAGPMAMIQSLSAHLLDDLQDDKNKDISKLIDLIRQSSQQGTQLIQEFVSQEFLESTHTEVIKQRIDIVERMKKVMEKYSQTENETSKTYHFYASSDSIYMELDDNKFMQCINNLISNAIKFTPDGGTITVSVEKEQDTVLFTVADNGIGIPAKYHNSLFDKFTEARRPGIKGEPSIGLGMSIIKTIVEWHKGQIWFESEESKGSTFYIRLPKK
ncbi:PAS domain-containing sensor histidine kinase [Pontibacter diazotrophicus]|uniref:histidine kinase n=1 Tax=Pontibacter diazotrophicus TaxID=1400979 RepID=A0A3D8LB71_9BACT|nr:PAS domain-containing sensor histidine kinase [Pontibacter diazotrophicus]RDV14546.1 PAS domain-containing sensor histidine kinase [Pontibacter diazotrophicus]